MKKQYSVIFLLFLSILFSSKTEAQRVSAYQAGSYQVGLMNVRDLAVSSEPGFIFIDYNYWNKSDSYYDQNGDKVTSFQIDREGIQTTLDLSPQISGYMNVPVFFFVSNIEILGGRYIASINPIFLSSNYKMNIHASASDSSVISSGASGGFGDMSIMPLGLGWSVKDNIDFSFLYTAYLPTGRFEVGASDNLGKGYWTHQFQTPTYFYLKEKTTAFFIMPTFEMNGKVKGSDVRPGNRFSLDYGISHYLNSWLELEILNGHNWQTGIDQGNDVWWRNTPLSTKDQTSTFSLGFGVWPWESKLNIRAKYAMDYGTRERYKSEFWSLSAIFIPNLKGG